MLNKKIAIAILMIVLAVITIILGRWTKESKSIVENNKEQKIEEVATMTKKIDTNEWKIYKNEISGYELRHPNDWHCKEEKGNIIVNSFTMCNTAKADIHVQILSSKNIKDSLEYLKRIKGDQVGERESEKLNLNYKIAEVIGVRVDQCFKEPKYYDYFLDPFCQGTIVFIRNNKLFHIYFHFEKTEVDNIENILQSLKVE